MSDRPRPNVNDPVDQYLFDSLERIENKLDGYKTAGDTVHNRLILWCAVLTLVVGGGSLSMAVAHYL
jgi:hypothetical protein